MVQYLSVKNCHATKFVSQAFANIYKNDLVVYSKVSNQADNRIVIFSIKTHKF